MSEGDRRRVFFVNLANRYYTIVSGDHTSTSRSDRGDQHQIVTTDGRKSAARRPDKIL
jgi:hypothetical protein